MSRDTGRELMEGEFAAMRELYKVVPSIIPKPYAVGKVKSTAPAGHFVIYDFKDMRPELLDVKSFCSEVAKLHRNSVSPTGKFGFHTNTTHGKFPQRMEWNSSWEIIFRKLLSDLLILNLETNGPWKEFQDVYERALTLVLPKLIGPLESEGRTIKPCLLHGDLWEGNVGTSGETGRFFIFDASWECGEAIKIA